MSSNLLKKTINPNPSPTGKIWFGLYWFGAGDRTRTGTLSPAVDFESTTSTIPSHRQVCDSFFNRQPPLATINCGRLRRRDVAIVCGARRSPRRERLRCSPTAAPAAPSLPPPQAALRLAPVDFESTTSTIPSHRRAHILYTRNSKIARGKFQNLNLSESTATAAPLDSPENVCYNHSNRE